MKELFYGAQKFNGNITGWNVSNVTNMWLMFASTPLFNQPIGNWNVSKVTNMNRMFARAQSFDQVISGWDVSQVINMNSMFYNAGLSTANYDALLNSWSNLTLQNNVDFHAGSSTYSCLSEDARDILVNTFNWSISDGGLFGDNVSISAQPASSTSVYESTADIVISIIAAGDAELNTSGTKMM
jgi:surface protein